MAGAQVQIDPVFVLAGGMGTRVAHLTGAGQPKALLPVGGRPFIDLKLLQLRSQGVRHVLMLVGHGADQLRAHVGDGSRFNLRVEFVVDGAELLGTGGALAAALPRVDRSFWVTYGDTLLDVPLAEIQSWARQRDIDGVMAVLCNEDRWETSNVDVDSDLVTRYEKGAPPRTASVYRLRDVVVSANGVRNGRCRAERL